MLTTAGPRMFQPMSPHVASDSDLIDLTGVIEDLTQAVFQHVHVQAKVDEDCALIASLQSLKNDIIAGAELCTLADDGSAEIISYNEELVASGQQTWHNSPWLFCECYLFKRISTYFSLSKHWKDYDAFMNQKMSTFKSSQPAVAELAGWYRGLTSSHHEDVFAAQGSAEETIFREIFEICLWGNATDLSLLTNLSGEQYPGQRPTPGLRPAQVRPAGRDTLPGGHCLDNSGFELYVDLLLAGYLLSSGLAREVVFHPKNIPWFVSDVTPADFEALLGVLSDPEAFFGPSSSQDGGSSSLVEDLSFLSAQLEAFRQEGRLSIRTSSFWTLPCGFASLPLADPELFAELRASGLVIFKGDLNYRKLTGDRAWSPTTPFIQAITAPAPGGSRPDNNGKADAGSPSSSSSSSPIASMADLHVLALRTCKADVVIGLAPGRDEELRAATDPEHDASAAAGSGSGSGSPPSGPRRWAWSGKWAVIQFSQAR
ncbi:hypothetical protein PG994_005214 [Apiospora phragmitis]|uniref:Sugar phosphate phosphatase n=1 Tax=Apiospora phragmitis TaxID=2905665 RepID=A0ABR1VVW3_9PEZI